MSQQEPPAAQPPPPGSAPPGAGGPAPAGPAGRSGGHPPPDGRAPHREDDSRTAWAAGGTVFGGMLLLISGVLAVLEGIAGIAHDAVYAVTRGSYTYKFNERSWGWIHLVLGAVAALVGAGVLHGAGWARWAGVLIAGLSMVANFLFLPYQPVWAVVLIGIDVFVIWALATYHPGRNGRGRTAGGAW
jgi:hypothetical protein